MLFAEKLLFLCILNKRFMKKLVFLTGAGMSVESGFKTFRGNDGLWENYPVEQIATHEGWEADPTLVTNFYNMLRKKLYAAKPNEGHKLIKELEKDFEVTVITQNVDNLHEKAGSRFVLPTILTTIATSRSCQRMIARWSLAPRQAMAVSCAPSSSSSARMFR